MYTHCKAQADFLHAQLLFIDSPTIFKLLTPKRKGDFLPLSFGPEMEISSYPHYSQEKAEIFFLIFFHAYFLFGISIPNNKIFVSVSTWWIKQSGN